MKALKFAVVLLVAVAAWQIDMAVNCAHQCVHRPRAVRVQRPQATLPQSVSPPQCRGPQCQMPKPLPVPPSSSR